MAATEAAAQQAQQALAARYPQLHVMPSTSQLRGMMTIIRSRDTDRSDFVFYADRLIRLLVEEGTRTRTRRAGIGSVRSLTRARAPQHARAYAGLNHLPGEAIAVETPTGACTPRVASP